MEDIKENKAEETAVATEDKPIEYVKPIPGQRYMHYKGGLYVFLHMAKHSETGEDLVVYQSLTYGTYYVRPLPLWFEVVTKSADNEDKGDVTRFTEYNA